MRSLIAAAFVLLGMLAAAAQTPPAKAPAYAPGVSLQPVVIYDASGNIVSTFGGGSGGSGGTVYQGGTWTFGLSGPIPAGTNVIGAVTQSGGPWSITGSINISNFPSTQAVSLAAAIPYVITSAAQGAGGVVTGAVYSQPLLANNSNPYPFAYYTCSAYADVAGTLYIESTLDGTNFFPRNTTAGTAIAAGASMDVKVPMSTNGIRCRYVNGGVAQTKFLLTGSATRY